MTRSTRSSVQNKKKRKKTVVGTNNCIVPSSGQLAEYEDLLHRKEYQAAIYMIDSGVISVDQSMISTGEAAISLASAQNHCTFLQLVLNRGANVNLCTSKGRTPLMRAAAQADSQEALGLLLTAGADVFMKDTSGKTALDWARLTQNTEAVQLLEKVLTNKIVLKRRMQNMQAESNQRVGIIDTNEALGVQMAVALEKNDLVEMQQLVKESPFTVKEYETIHIDNDSKSSSLYFLNRESHLGWTPLAKAASLGDVPTVLLLLEHGVDVNYETKLHHTALTWASYCGHAPIVQILLTNGASLLGTTSEGKTALIHASCNGKNQVVDGLLQKYRNTSVRFQASHFNIKKERWYDIYATYLNHTDQEGCCALQHAQRQHHEYTVILLQTALARTNEERDREAQLENDVALSTCLACGFQGSAEAVEHHETHVCLERQVVCQRCQLDLIFKQLSQHETLKCPKRIVSCCNFPSGCLKEFAVDEIEMHEREHCKKRVVECQLQCGLQVQEGDRNHHEMGVCPNRMAICKDCQQSMSGHDLRPHRRHSCPMRTLVCDLHGGCGVQYKAKDRHVHEETLCLHRKLPCTFSVYGCTEKIGPESTRRMHEKLLCEFQAIPCTLGCSLEGIVRFNIIL